MQDDTDNIQALPPTDEEQGLHRKKRDKLPKFVLGKHENFYIPREELTALNDSYNQMLSDMDESPANEELRSYMESVIFTSYVSEIEKKQRDNCLECEVERQRVETLNCALTPRRWRSIFTLFRLRRNQSAILLDELINRQARSYYYKKENELPVMEEEEETEYDPYSVQIETLRAYLPRMRKKKRALLERIISGLSATYENKEAKMQSLKSELQAEKAKVEELKSELQAVAKQEAVKRLMICLKAVKEVKESAELEAKELEECEPEEEPAEQDEETDEIEYWGDEEPEEEFGDEIDSE